MKRKASVLESPQFRALDGTETATIIVNRIAEDFKVELRRALDATNNFLPGDTYPAVAIDGQLKVNPLPNQSYPAPFYVNVHMILGTSIDTAPDRLREQYDLPVLQPQKRASGFIMNQEVPKDERQGNESRTEGGSSSRESGEGSSEEGTVES